MARRRPEPTANPARGAALVVVAVVIGLLLLRERSRHLRGHHHQRGQRQLDLRRKPYGRRHHRRGPGRHDHHHPRRGAPAAGGGAHDRAQRLGDPGRRWRLQRSARVARLPRSPTPRARTRRIRTRPVRRRPSSSRRASKARRPRSRPPSVLPTSRPPRCRPRLPARSRAPAWWWSSAPTWPASRPPRHDHHHRRELTRAGGWWTHAPSSAVTPRRPRCSSTSTARSRRSWRWRRTPARSPGAVEVLAALAERFAVVAVVSGRPVAFLLAHLPGVVELHGLYGLEAVVDGAPIARAEAQEWRAVVDEVARSAVVDGPPGLDVEHKGLSLTLHYRRQPELADAALALGGAAPRSDRGSRCGGRRCRSSSIRPWPWTRGRWSRPGPPARRRWPTSAMTRVTCRPSPRSTGWPPEGSRP